MRNVGFSVLAVTVILAVAACAGSPAKTPSAPASTSPAGASAAPSAPSSAATGGAVSIANFSFQPSSLTVPAGTTVTWTNNDSTGHTVTADDGSFKSDTIGSGATFSQTFSTPGTFAYHCSIHPSMTGTIKVQ